MSKNQNFCAGLVIVVCWLGSQNILINECLLYLCRNGTVSMNGPGDIPDPTERNPCGITSFFPLGMSCRGKAEAFARRLQSRLRTLGTQVSLCSVYGV